MEGVTNFGVVNVSGINIEEWMEKEKELLKPIIENNNKNTERVGGKRE